MDIQAWVTKITSFTGITEDPELGNEEESTGLINEIGNKYCALTWEQRIIGFIICFSVGMLMSFLSTLFSAEIFLGHPKRFTIFYSLSALCSMGSSLFLMGPVSQLKSMFDPTRVLATSVYIGSVICTLLAAILVKTLAWYCLSYVPYGREMVLSCFQGTFGI